MAYARHSRLITVAFLSFDSGRSAWLVATLARDPEIRVVLRSTNLSELGPRRIAADLFIWDLAGSGSPGESVVEEFYHRLPGDPALLVIGSDPAIRGWIDSHPAAWGWLGSDLREETLLETVHSIAAGLLVMDRELYAADRGAYAADRGAYAEDREFYSGEHGTTILSPRELETLRLLARGLSNREISAQLGISENTVKFHVSGVYGKLGVRSRAEAVGAAIRSGYLAL
jgi:DNA-binding NarL/FixJ family response regulator